MSVTPPFGLLAELTHRCPLRCAWCSVPLELVPPCDELATATWQRVLREAAALGVVQVFFAGGEPLLREDLEQLVACADRAGLEPALVTSGLGLDRERLEALRDAGLGHLHLGLQLGSSGEGLAGSCRHESLDAKAHVAHLARGAGLELTLDVTLRGPAEDADPAAAIEAAPARVDDVVALALELDAGRLELAWSHERVPAWLEVALPTPARAAFAARIEHWRATLGARLAIHCVGTALAAGRPRPCTNGWASSALVVAPDGRVLPPRGAAALRADPRFPRVTQRALATLWQELPWLAERPHGADPDAPGQPGFAIIASGHTRIVDDSSPPGLPPPRHRR